MINRVKNISNNELTLKTGIITEEEFVHLFGTQKQISSWNENNKFKSLTTEKNVLENAKRLCQITKLSDGKYSIKRIYDYPIPKNFEKMNSGIYKTIIPILLYRLIENDENNKLLKLTIGYWAREINMVNENYTNGRRSHEALADHTKINERYIKDFYSHTDSQLNNYIKNSLSYLKEAAMILWDESYNIIQDKSTCEKTWDNNVIINDDIETRRITDDEFKYYSHCVEIADNECNIKSASERFYSSKSNKWNTILHRELWKHNIVAVYKTYNIVSINKQKIEHLLKQFGSAKPETLINRLTKEFSELIIKNADKRFCVNSNHYFTTEQYYHNMFSKMCRLTINPKAKTIINLRRKDIQILDNSTNEIQQPVIDFL